MKQLAGLTAGAFALVAAFSGSALADGMVRRAKAPPPPPPPVQDRCAPGPWTGFYVGGNVGFAHSEGEFRDHDNFFSWTNNFNHDEDSFTGGIQTGYNLQCGNVVFGFEADWNWINFNDDDRRLGWYDNEFRVGRSFDWFGTLRGRIGWTNNRVMVYATGGAAYTNGDHNWRGWGPDGYAFINDSGDVRWGWTAGGGVEWLWSDRITMRAEALWVDFEDGSKSRIFTLYDSYSDSYYDKKFRFNHDDTMWVARVGLNFKFGGREPVYEPLK
jgi:outer membrane immunogenic protein